MKIVTHTSKCLYSFYTDSQLQFIHSLSCDMVNRSFSTSHNFFNLFINSSFILPLIRIFLCFNVLVNISSKVFHFSRLILAILYMNLHFYSLIHIIIHSTKLLVTQSLWYSTLACFYDNHGKIKVWQNHCYF